jgi:hypothetical protein
MTMTEHDNLVQILGTVRIMHDLVIEVQAAFAATQLGLIAVVEQLSQSGNIDCEAAADRMRILASSQSGISAKAVSATAKLAEDIEAFAQGSGPKPPRGGKPKLVR